MRTLKIESLPSAKEWIDRDEIMLHACFQILKDCVEKEKVDEFCDFETHKDFVTEVRFLYNWWNTREDSNYTEDDEMLLRLLKIRGFLWT